MTIDDIKRPFCDWLDTVVARGTKYRPPVEIVSERAEKPDGWTTFRLTVLANRDADAPLPETDSLPDSKDELTEE